MINLDKYLVDNGPYATDRLAPQELAQFIDGYNDIQREIADRDRVQCPKPKTSSTLKLLSDQITKHDKTSKEYGINQYGLALAQSDASNVVNVCSFATDGCRRACIAEFGKGGIPSVKFARTVKAIALHRMPELFIKRLASEIKAKVALEGEIFCRLNDYSDLRWELIAPSLFDIDGVTYWDYTKHPRRDVSKLDNYTVVFSAHEKFQDSKIPSLSSRYDGVAVVFSDYPTFTTYKETPVKLGIHDNLADMTSDGFTVIALKAKGKARTDSSGFVRILN